jgi:hypothetical protein
VSVAEKDRVLGREILIDSSGLPESVIHHRQIVRSAYLIRYVESLDVGLVVTSNPQHGLPDLREQGRYPMQCCWRGTT